MTTHADVESRSDARGVGISASFFEVVQERAAAVLFFPVFLSLPQILLRRGKVIKRGDVICARVSLKASREAEWSSPKSSRT